MDMLTLIDELDALIRNARPVPLTTQVRIEQKPFLDLLDRMRGQLVREGDTASPDARALTDAVSAAIRENIPEIARAVAAENAAQRPSADPPTPPGAPF
jgi:hypothetical protein